MARQAVWDPRGLVYSRGPVTLVIALLTASAGANGWSAESAASAEAASMPQPAATTTATDYSVLQGLPLAAGRTPGTFEVTHSGAATYRIPLWTPPGIGDLGARLDLVYNSRSGNGTLGVGWTLAGLSQITRCNRTWAQDGAPQPVTNAAGDRYCLDGQPLRLVAGAHGADGSVYATEIETFARVVAHGASGGGPSSFTVTRRDGVVHQYGSTADSRAHAGASATVRAWALAGIRDRAGNAVRYSYHNDAQPAAYGDGTLRIAAISYPVTAAGHGPYYHVRFAYSPRAAQDAPVGYLAGTRVREPWQLDSVSIRIAGTEALIKGYHFGYGIGGASGRLRLATVQECSASSCLRATRLQYQDGARGWLGITETGVAASAARNPVPVDLDGDGLTDLLYPVDAGSGRVSWRITLARASGYSAPFDTGLVTASSAAILPGQFSGNGRMQFLVPLGTTWHVAGFGAGGFAVASTGLPVAGEYGAADIDGDGLADLVSKSGGFTPTVSVRRNVTVPAAGVVAAKFAGAAQVVWTAPLNRQSMPWDNLRVVDLNGDGRADIVALTFTSSERLSRFFATPLISNGFGVPFTIAPERQIWQESMVTSGDWNADGCTDIVQVPSVYVSDCAGGFVEIPTRATPAAGNRIYTALPVDWNGDGRTDLLYIDAATSHWYVVPSTGTGAGVPTPTGIPAPTATAWYVHDADGDGLVDLGYRDGNNGNRLRYRAHAAPSVAPDLLASVVDGFGVSAAPAYVPISRSHYTRLADATYPEADYQGALYVVAEVSHGDGVLPAWRQRYLYRGARVHLQGRGFLGFEQQRIEDSRHGLVVVDEAARSFPFTGMHIRRTVQQLGGTRVVSEWSAQPAARVLASGTSESRHHPYVAGTVQTLHEVGGALDGTAVRETRTTREFADGYGNLTSLRVAVTDRDPHSPMLGARWESTTRHEYANDPSSWCVGLPTSVVRTDTAPAQTPSTRTQVYDVDVAACRVTRKVLEPGTPALRIAVDYGYDTCGNVDQIRVTGADPDGSPMAPRETSLAYGARCQAPQSITNALGHVARYEYRDDFVVPVRTVDANGLATTWRHDDHGRPLQELRPDGTQATRAYEPCDEGTCWGTSGTRFVVQEAEIASDGTLVRRGRSLYDPQERPRAHQAQGPQGQWIEVTRSYDALGRVTLETVPSAQGTRNGHRSYGYDLLGRVVAERLHDASGAVVRAGTVSRAGGRVETVDSLGRAQVQVHDAVGRLRRVIDPAPGGTTRYDYDALGQLVRIEDAIGAASTAEYTVHGFRTRWSDAAAGTWLFRGNSLGERLAWVDANGRSFAARYDALGRIVARTDPEGTSTWAWGQSASARNVGRLQSKAGHGYTESLEYDVAGRIAARTIVTDQPYRYDYSYGPSGQLEELAYPASPVPAGSTGPRVRIRHAYDHGHPSAIHDVTEPGAPRTLWSLQRSDDARRPVDELLANGIARVLSGYDAASGALLSRESVSGSGTPYQRLAWEWDAAGQLVARRDLARGLAETYTHDALGRLAGSSLDGVPNLAMRYDAAGNVLHKSDVGDYRYGDASRPHLVTAAGADTYAHDRNGNVVARNGLPQQWASWNLPTVLQHDGQSSSFAYGPGRERWRQVATYSNGIETTHYAGRLLEKESTTSTGLTYWRHYVPTPGGTTVVIARDSSRTATTMYVLPDAQGSSDVLLDGSGALRARLSYTAFGARRGASGNSSSAPEWAAIANTTRQGYTGHEMLDNVGLVHMHGRVYDPRLGRFLSADPVAGDLRDPQSLHPYAYVGNRPYGAVDPSGLAAYVPDGACGGICATVVASVLRTAFGGGRSPPPPPPATALPGQSAQNGAGLCGPGTFSPLCGGHVLYAAAPPQPGRGPGTSTWGAVEADPYADERLHEFFRDLGRNTIIVLVLEPIGGLRDAWNAVGEGDYLEAAVGAGAAACDIAKPCKGVEGSFRAVQRAAGAARRFVPDELARVVAGRRNLATLGRPDAPDVFVVDAADIAGLDARQIAQRLTIPEADTFTVIRFPTPSTGIASPVFRGDPGFIPGGLTRGGAREYVIPNGPLPPGARIEMVGK